MTQDKSGADAVAEGLVEAGIEVVFGIPGVYNVGIFDAVRRRPELRVVAVRHEQGAAFMADGYARASGKPAACILLPGCGVLNAMTALSEAYADSSPVLLLATQVEREHIDANRGLLHELTGQLDVVGSVMKSSERVNSAAAIPGAIRRALQTMTSGRKRPAQIEIPLDVQSELFDPSAAEPDGIQALTPPSDPESIAEAAESLARAERPLIVAGGGVISSGASDALVKLAERLGAPVITTGMGAGSIPGDHPLVCGVAWIASADVRPLVGACDAFLAVGTRFNQAMTADWELPLPEATIRIDIDAEEIERNLPIKQKLVGDARTIVEALDHELSALGVDRAGIVDPTLLSAQTAYRDEHWRRVGSTRPWANALRTSLPRDTVICADMSVFWADMLGSFPIYEPRSMLFPWGMGTLGFGLPVALGAKIACPERPVIGIVGDGAFLFTGGELATAVQEQLAVPIIVVNNAAYGMIKMQQRRLFGADVAVDLVTPDFVALARAFGADGERAETSEELGSAVTRALGAAGPTVIEVPWGYTFSD